MNSTHGITQEQVCAAIQMAELWESEIYDNPRDGRPKASSKGSVIQVGQYVVHAFASQGEIILTTWHVSTFLALVKNTSKALTAEDYRLCDVWQVVRLRDGIGDIELPRIYNLQKIGEK